MKKILSLKGGDGKIFRKEKKKRSKKVGESGQNRLEAGVEGYAVQYEYDKKEPRGWSLGAPPLMFVVLPPRGNR